MVVRVRNPRRQHLLLKRQLRKHPLLKKRHLNPKRKLPLRQKLETLVMDVRHAVVDVTIAVAVVHVVATTEAVVVMTVATPRKFLMDQSFLKKWSLSTDAPKWSRVDVVSLFPRLW